jgi:hypothetical protein
MLILLLRVPLTLLYAYYFYRGSETYGQLSTGGVVAFLGYALFGAIALAVLWAPVIGQKLSDPLTSSLTQETSLPPETNLLVRRIHRLQRRGHHRLALFLVFAEGIRHPDLPLPPLLGLRSARPGSFLEKCFAKEVFRYNNIQNCLQAYTILKSRHGFTPPLHQHPEVNLAILNLTRERPPEPAKLHLKPGASLPRAKRDPRIRLFEE